MKMLHMVAFALVIIGGLNWLLVGVVSWDIGDIFGGQDNVVSRIIYILVGLSAAYLAVTHKATCKECEAGLGGAMAKPKMPGVGGSPPA